MRVGEKIPLDLVLWDGVGDKFVKAIIRDGKNEIPGSPKPIPHNSEGHYYYNGTDILVPDGAKAISIEYVVYNDASFTQESSGHERALDIFEIDREASGGLISDKITQLIEIVTSHGLNSRLIGSVSSDKLVGTLVEDELEAKIGGDPVLIGFLSDENTIGETESETITAEMEK